MNAETGAHLSSFISPQINRVPEWKPWALLYPVMIVIQMIRIKYQTAVFEDHLARYIEQRQAKRQELGFESKFNCTCLADRVIGGTARSDG